MLKANTNDIRNLLSTYSLDTRLKLNVHETFTHANRVVSRLKMEAFKRYGISQKCPKK